MVHEDVPPEDPIGDRDPEGDHNHVERSERQESDGQVLCHVGWGALIGAVDAVEVIGIERIAVTFLTPAAKFSFPIVLLAGLVGIVMWDYVSVLERARVEAFPDHSFVQVTVEAHTVASHETEVNAVDTLCH